MLLVVWLTPRVLTDGGVLPLFVLVAEAGYREGGVFYCCWWLEGARGTVCWGILGMYTKINVVLTKISLK